MEKNDLKSLLKAKKMTQRELADAIGISEKAICWRIKGNTRWRVPEAVVVSQILGIPLKDMPSYFK